MKNDELSCGDMLLDELIRDLLRHPDEKHLWDCIIGFQGYPFYTVSGLPFSYKLKTGRNGQPTKELWIDRREHSKSLAWSSVCLAFENVVKMQNGQDFAEKRPLIMRPKGMGDIRGVSYIYPIFYKFGLIRIPEKAECGRFQCDRFHKDFH